MLHPLNRCSKTLKRNTLKLEKAVNKIIWRKGHFGHVFLYLCIFTPWVKAIDDKRILPPADLFYLYSFPIYDHLKITEGAKSIFNERAKMKECTNFTIPCSFLPELFFFIFLPFQGILGAYSGHDRKKRTVEHPERVVSYMKEAERG